MKSKIICILKNFCVLYSQPSVCLCIKLVSLVLTSLFKVLVCDIIEGKYSCSYVSTSCDASIIKKIGMEFSSYSRSN